MSLLNWDQLLRQALPTFKRKPRYLDFVRALTWPLRALNALFNTFRNRTRYQLLFTGQTIYLEHYLNDLYDPTDRLIFIENLERDFVYLYNVSEGVVPPEYLFNLGEVDALPLYLKNLAEIDLEDSFIVWVPVGISYGEVVMRAQIDQYRASGRSYSIQTYVP